MIAPDNSPINYRVAEFAWRVKNWVRPLGLNALNLPCQLMGTGMAFPWEVIRSANLASGSIVEDLKLGLDLTQTGSPPLFCPSACVKSHFPLSIEGAKSQRKRWEEGHISMILTTVPRFIYEAVVAEIWDFLRSRSIWQSHPLSLLVILLAGMSFVAAVTVLFGSLFLSSDYKCDLYYGVGAGHFSFMAEVRSRCPATKSNIFDSFIYLCKASYLPSPFIWQYRFAVD